MKRFFIAVCILIVGSVVLGTWLFIQKSDKAYDEGTVLPFEDVSREDWYYDYVAQVYDCGWLKGRTLTQFDPSGPLLRGDCANMLYAYLGKPDVTGFDNPFTDLEDALCRDSVVYLKKLGVLTGKTDDRFDPYGEMTREQLVTVLYRLGGYQIHEELSPSGKFTDRDDISPWALEAVDWAIHNGFLSGLTETTLGPQKTATRAQAAKILCLYAEKAGYKTDTSHSGSSVTLRVWQAGIDDSNTALTMVNLLNRFEKQNPGITVEYVPIPTIDDPYEKIQSALEKGEGPDVVLVSSPYEMLLADEGLILPLDTLFTESVLKDIHPALLVDCSYSREPNPELQGKLVSAPLFSTPRALLINRSVFDHFGISYPDNTYSFHTLLSQAEAATGSMDGRVIYGFGTRADSPSLYLSMIWAAGGSIVDAHTGLATTNNDLWRKTTEDYLSLYTRELTPDYNVSMDLNSQLGMFAKGSVAMIDASLNAPSLIQDKQEWQDNLAVYPFLDNSPGACLSVGEVAVISHSTEHIVDSAKLINFLMEPDAQIVYSSGAGYLPGVLSALEESALKTDPYFAPYQAGMEDTLALGDRGYAVYCLIRDELQKVLRGELSPEDYCAGLESKINALFTTE